MNRKVCLFLLFALIVSSIAQYGSISGRIIDSETGEPLAAANIKLRDTVLGAATNLDGEYRIDRIDPGFYTIIVSTVGYSKYEVIEIEVKEEENTKLNITLSPEAIKGKEVVVTAKSVNTATAGLLANQKRAQSISTGISAEQIAKAPDSKAADIMKRITGLSIVDDKFVFVRGLSERYSNAQLNKANIPSPEPDKRIVPFDIFPSNLLDNIVVRKAFIPSLPGDFAGGCIQLTTKEFPQSFTGKFNISYGSNSNMVSNSDFQTYDGGSIDRLGFDDGTRAMPEDVEEASHNSKIREGGMFGGGFTPEEVEEFGESFSNVWSPYSISAPVNQSYSVSLGNQFNFLDRPLGWVSSLTYKNKYSYREEERFYYINGADGLEARHHYQDYSLSKMNIVLGGILNGSYRITPNDKVSVKMTYTHNTDDEVRFYGMYPNRDHNLDEECTRLRWVERTLFATDISGEHQFQSIKTNLKWRGNLSLAKRNEPDTREILYESPFETNEYILADESNSGSRFFSYLTDYNYDFAVDMEVPFFNLKKLPSKLETGVSLAYKDREIDSRRFRFKPEDFNEVDISGTPEEIFSPENIGSDGFQLEEDTRATDNYKAKQTIMAGYAMVDMSMAVLTRVVAGVRVENSIQEVETYELFNPEADPIIGNIEKVDFMPAVSITHKITEDMNLRVGFSQTVSRPSFRELSKLEFTDIGGHAVVGNPDLDRAIIQNYDLGWEWYPGIGENISFALMYKSFTNPIEQTLINATELTSSWQNAKSAYNYGLEIEARKNLGFISKSMNPFGITGNLTLIKSEVQLQESGMETSKTRPLQGQSPYVINGMFSYKHPDWGTEINLSYNVFGERIAEVGITGTPDIYEEPFDKLDIVFNQPIGNFINVKLNVENILNPEIEYTQGDEIQRHYKLGTSFSLSAGYSF